MGLLQREMMMENETATFLASLEVLSTILSWVRARLEDVSLSTTKKQRVEVAIEEAVVNVIQHAAAKDPLELIVSFRHEPGRQIEFELRDGGAPFNPLQHSPPSSEGQSIQEHPVGGLGITFIRKCMDALFYRYEDEQNILTLVKSLSQENAED